MAARKLQTEIDRTLKKVAEGVELFETIYDKMQASTNQTQKEKLELDLKTQIKKLQRMRDQIKTWVSGNEIKDKSQLLDNRRLIETQMEKFKACEKEMKTKAYSKAGLIQAATLDPKEQEKEEIALWLRSQVEELQMQVEQTEAEIEALQGTTKKRNKAATTAGRQEDLEHLNERRKWHIGRLELILRLVDNGSMSADKVLRLKEDVQFFVDTNTGEDFDEDEGIYDELNLDEEEEKFGRLPPGDESDESDIASEDLPPRTPKKHDEESVTSSKREDSPILKKAAITLQLRKPSIDAKPPPNINFAQQPMASILKAGLQPAPRPPVTLPPIPYAEAAAGAVAPAPNHQVPPTAHQPPAAAVQTTAPPDPVIIAQTAPSIPQSTSQSSSQDHLSSPSLTHPSTTSPMLSSSASVSHQPDGSFYSGQESPVMSEAAVSSLSGPAATSSPQRGPSRKASISSPMGAATLSPVAAQQSLMPTESSQLQTQSSLSNQTVTPSSSTQAPQVTGPSPLPQQVQQYANTTATSSSSPLPGASQVQPQFPPGVKVQQGLTGEQPGVSLLVPSAQQSQTIGGQRPPSAAQKQRTNASNAFPGSLSDLVMSFESVKEKAAHRMTNLDQVHKLLEGGYSNVPQPQDTEKPKYYVPRNPFQTAPYYPQAPHPLLSTAGIFSQLDVETLFYVFYFLPGTYQQFLAAKELKRQSWRFHVKYLTWFQRHSEPQAITEEYEQGVYVYFDWEGSWCQRKKSDFRFEYRYLSED